MAGSLAVAADELASQSLARKRIWGSLGGRGSSTPVVVAGLFQGYLAYNMARKALAVAAPGKPTSKEGPGDDDHHDVVYDMKSIIIIIIIMITMMIYGCMSSYGCQS